MELIKRKGESYQHAAARTVFKHWLEQSGGRFGPLGWTGPVYEEYPFIEGFSSQTLREIGPNIPMANPPIPTYEELIAYNFKVLAIADIVTIHKGDACYLIEIVHKNEVSEKKIERLKTFSFAFGLEIYRVEAHWILSQVDVPTNFPQECFRRII